ncbi:MAG: HlyC/CorC family transporter [Chloroflexi bacterium]|nr:HlyC/CorC family transporter [Chloroflexota bacterium]
MESYILLNFVILLVCLALSAFFSSSETAFISLSRVRLRHLLDSGVVRAERVFRMVEHPDRLLTTVLLGNNLVNTAAAAIGTVIAVSLFGPGTGVIVATAAVTVLLVVLGEVFPKVLAARHAERLALAYVGPLEWVETALFPLTWLLRKMSRKAAGSGQTSLVGEGELRAAIALGREGGAVEHSEAEMLHRVLEFGDRQVREVMTPRMEIVAVAKGTRLQDFLALYKTSAHTRFPVYEGNIDNVIGILSVKDVLRAVAGQRMSPDSPVTDLARPASFAPETKQVRDLFQEMRSRGLPMTMVVDEFGGIAGLVSVNQLVEEIVGPVGEAQPTPDYEAIDERTFQVEGSMRIDEANEKLGLGLPEGDYETIAGFVLASLGRIPQEGEHLRHNSFKLVVTQMKGVKIEKVLVTRSI